MKFNQNLLVQACIDNLTLEGAKLSDSYYYASLPLCVIDAVFSIGVRYSSVLSTVKRFVDYYRLPHYRAKEDRVNDLPEYTINDFLKDYQQVDMVSNVFQNMQRTSTKSGILKAEACKLVAQVLKFNGINTLNDMRQAILDPIRLESIFVQLKTIPGQKSGISSSYLCMLAGDDNFIKPDRHILNFIRSQLNLLDNPTAEEAQILLIQVAKILKSKYPNLTPRLLDHSIWKWQRDNARK